jgi:hypothetical protein
MLTVEPFSLCRKLGFPSLVRQEGCNLGIISGERLSFEPYEWNGRNGSVTCERGREVLGRAIHELNAGSVL